MTEDEITQHKEAINKLSHMEMARLWRFAPSGHIYFDKTYSLFEHFEKRFRSLGFFTPAISKAIGWDN